MRDAAATKLLAEFLPARRPNNLDHKVVDVEKQLSAKAI
jgi:hypothetical protein